MAIYAGPILDVMSGVLFLICISILFGRGVPSLSVWWVVGSLWGGITWFVAGVGLSRLFGTWVGGEAMRWSEVTIDATLIEKKRRDLLRGRGPVAESELGLENTGVDTQSIWNWGFPLFILLLWFPFSVTFLVSSQLMMRIWSPQPETANLLACLLGMISLIVVHAFCGAWKRQQCNPL